MKISLKTILVGAGLVAILLAYRANGKNAASKDLFYASSGDIKLAQPSINTNHSSLSQTEFEPRATFEIEAEFESLPDPQWVDDAGDADLKTEIENEVMMVAESRQRDAFEDFDLNEESPIPTRFDGSEDAKPVSFVDAAPSMAPDMPQVTVALNEAAALKAVHHIEYGKSLARRNATEAAGQEFLGALRVLAESNDVLAGGSNYTNALRRGLQAMKEAEDFKVTDPQRQISLNVATVIEGHQTRLIGINQAKSMSASRAARRYLEFAGLQLGTCGGQNPVSAEALYCLGKMRTISAQSNPDPESKELFEAIIFQHAALTADPSNHRSANELGVLLARNGQLAAAETYLKNSLQLKQTPQGWANLAKVHQRKGTSEDQHLASLAINEYQASLHRQAPTLTDGPIQLVGAQEFVARTPVQHPNSPPAIAGHQLERIPVSVPDEKKPSIAKRIGSLFVPNKTTR